LVGVDGERIWIDVPDPADGEVSHIMGAGMPVRRGSLITGRGSLFVRWKFATEPPSRWRTMKRFLSLKR